MRSRVRLFSPDRSSSSAASLCGPIRLATWSRSSYAPGHQVRFGSLNYMADIRGDLIFDGFEPRPSAPHYPEGHDLALPLNSVLEAAPTPVPTLNSEPIAPIKDERLDVTSGAAISK